MNPPNIDHLRPIERRVLAMDRQGLNVEEIARRLQRSPGFVARLMRWVDIPRCGQPKRLVPPALEHRVVALRTSNLSHEQIAKMFRRSPRFIKQIEGLTYIRHGMDALVFDQGTVLLRQAADEARQNMGAEPTATSDSDSTQPTLYRKSGT